MTEDLLTTIFGGVALIVILIGAFVWLFCVENKSNKRAEERDKHQNELFDSIKKYFDKKNLED